ncbi:MAG: alanine racemase [Oscillospiraceae bacterium]|jgi:alanine racemase|nr:alanine racemase [Oscillospiraceae bacterium]
MPNIIAKDTLRAWAEVDLGAIEHNYAAIRGLLKAGTRFLGVVKADAYGHGAAPVAGALARMGCEYLGVACLSEAIALRDRGARLPILILGHTPPEYTRLLTEYDITQAVCGLGAALEYSKGARGARLRAHIKLDTGMGRLGAWGGTELERALSLPNLCFEGIFTHFAESESDDSSFTRSQLRAFQSRVDALQKSTGHKFDIRHCANSAAVIKYAQAHLDMIRPGIALYGYYPGLPTDRPALRPSMSLRARIMQVKRIGKGDTVSYGRRYTAGGERTVAVLPVGYADGLHRSLSGKIDVLINGRRAPQIGTICMDACMADITGIPGVAAGSVATLIGADGDERIFADELARLAGTLSHEILTSISVRIPRVYAGSGGEL